jgi:hypothetical protein
MHHHKFRHIAAAGAIAVIAAVPLAACGDPSVSARPAQAAENETSAAPSRVPSTAPSASARAENTVPGVARQPAGQRPVKTGTVRPATTGSHTSKPAPTKSTGACYGAVRHDLDLHNTVLDLVKSMCFHTGGVLRLQGIGPGLVTATPGPLVSQSYEAGVVDLRFVRAGTVTVSIPQDERTYTITVVVVS